MNKGRTPILACGPFLLVLMLGSCGDRTTPSAEENRQLDNAAAMLDQAPEVLANVHDNSLGNSDTNSASSDGSGR